MVKNTNQQPEVEDSASSAQPAANKAPTGSKNQSKGGKNNSSKSNTPKGEPSSSSRNSPANSFPEGNKILESYGLSVSGRKERVLSLFKTEKFFHIVEDAWSQLVDAKPDIADRFSLAEFRHCSALQLFQRIEQVKFDALGVKPSAPTRIPLPRNLRVFLPIWSTLANIGIVNDDDLRVTYIPDGSLPKTEDLTDPDDAINLIACTLYDWQWSWEQVLSARRTRKTYEERIGASADVETNEQPMTQADFIRNISQVRREMNAAHRMESSGSYKVIDGTLYRIPPPPEGHTGEWHPTDDQIREGSAYSTYADKRAELDLLLEQARKTKEQMIRPRLTASFDVSAYQLSDGSVSASPGAYGRWLHWDPQLWLEYEQTAEILAPVAMFSLSMPVETTGTYAWLIPVESRQDEMDVFCKLPKASVEPRTWILAMLIQSSTLPLPRRSTWYCETDKLVNVIGLRNRWIRAAIKRGAPIEQYGTY